MSENATSKNATSGKATGRKPGLNTRLVHAGERAERIAGAVIPPIFLSSVFEIETTGYEDLRYPRYSNLPDQEMLATKLADLEEGEAALVTSSGMAAISGALLSVLSSGDHLLGAGVLYGGTHSLITDRFNALGIAVDLVPGDDPEAWSRALRPTTRAIYVEAITNPLVGVPDLTAVVAFAREHGLVSLIDSTFASPVNFQPLVHGFDLCLHSATKYLNGHSDVAAGVVVGSAAAVAKVHKVHKQIGGTLDGQAVHLLMRGVKTLDLRVRRQNDNALGLARHLEAHPRVARVTYPGLPSHPGHERARRLFSPGFGGMLSFEIDGGWAEARAFLGRVRLATHAASLGGIETLVVSPARSSHAALTPEQRQAAGISDSLVRVSVGIEDLPDLIDDFDQALVG